MYKAKRPAYEIVIVAIVVTLSIVLSAALYSGRMQIRKSNMIIHELAMLRSSITLYKMINRENPVDLEVLAKATYQADEIKRTYVDHLPRDKSGKVVDPFGNAYRYDATSGWVQSTTKGFERW